MPVHVGIQWPTAEAARACPRSDLQLHVCAACSHIFNAAFDPDRVTYEASYDNALDHSPRFRAYADHLANRLVQRYELHGQRIMEIGCGNGAFLTRLCTLAEAEGIGFDPSYQPHASPPAVNEHIQFIADLYTERYSSYTADFVCCRHVLEHIDTPSDFLTLVHQAVAGRPRPAAYFEVPNVAFILREMSVWDIIYEHCSYFSLPSLTHLFQRAGFAIRDAYEAYDRQFLGIEVTPAPPSHASRSAAPFSRQVDDLRRQVASFTTKIRPWLLHWTEQLHALHETGQRVVLWGAGSKAIGFSNLLQLDEIAPYVVDINRNKQGAYLAGTGQRIVAPRFLQAYRPDAIVVMNPTYAQEIQSMTDALGISARFLYAS